MASPVGALYLYFRFTGNETPDGFCANPGLCCRPQKAIIQSAQWEGLHTAGSLIGNHRETECRACKRVHLLCQLVTCLLLALFCWLSCTHGNLVTSLQLISSAWISYINILICYRFFIKNPPSEINVTGTWRIPGVSIYLPQTIFL